MYNKSMENYGLVIVNEKVSTIFTVDNQGQGNGYVVGAPGIKPANFAPVHIDDTLRIFKHLTLNFFILWSSNKDELEYIKESIDKSPKPTS